MGKTDGGSELKVRSPDKTIGTPSPTFQPINLQPRGRSRQPAPSCFSRRHRKPFVPLAINRELKLGVVAGERGEDIAG